jgi:hypothetical protein
MGLSPLPTHFSCFSSFAMLPLSGRIPLVIAAALVLAGCQTPISTGRSPLRPSQMSPDSVAVDIVFVHFPLGDHDANGKLWNDVDEQGLPTELRERLARNGFRVGLIGGQVPEVLAKLLELSDKPTRRDQQRTAADMENNKHPILRHLQMRAGNRNEILASGIYESLPLLLTESGDLRGQTYSQAQGILAARAFPLADGRVRLELTPELHHGQPRPRLVGDQAMMRLDTARPRRVFDELTTSVVIAPGTMVILSCLPDRPGSLGHYFFTEGEDNRVEQKLLLVRLCQTQHDDLVTPPPLPLAE